MHFLRAALSNHILNLCFLTWFLAQFSKFLITLLFKRQIVPERLYGSGGMPSAHTATVCALMMGTSRQCGYASAEFAISAIVAAIVIYDALGVRRAAGRHASMINRFLEIDEIADALFDEEEIGEDDTENVRKNYKKLNESLGHTPLEVMGGALLAIVVSMVYNFFAYLQK